jgi:FlaA1/EpsC-like NDP-sugar epimerase
MDIKKVETILGRKVLSDLSEVEYKGESDEKLLITGAGGSIGQELIKRLNNSGFKNFLPTDVDGDFENLDVTNENEVKNLLESYLPTKVINLAGAKHAPEGELTSWNTLNINTIGTLNLINNLPKNSKIILTSTCKSANPEVVYGASKLIAERMVLNSGGSVSRFFNVVETSGNVFTIWDEVNENLPIDLAPTCERYFISIQEAVGLLIFTLNNEPGRFLVNTVNITNMGDLANRLYPDRKKNIIEPRRGDRLSEKFISTSESVEKYYLNNSVVKVKSIHDYKKI